MKTIGLLGGMSWESSAGYYRVINTGVRQSLGDLHSAKIVMYSVDFASIESLQQSGDWQQCANILSDAAAAVERAGADFLLICTNTMHKVADDVDAAIGIPLLHIADATAEALIAEEIKCVGLLGTAFTMEQGFYKDRLRERYQLDVLVPDKTDREVVHRVIYKELCLGDVRDDSKREFLRIIDALRSRGAQAVILGCTEIGMLVKQSDTSVALFDTTSIHAKKAVDFALGV